MPRLEPPKHTRFKKGVSGNPGGKPRNLFSTDQLKKVIARHFAMTKEEIGDVLRDSKSRAIDLIVCSAINRAIKDGDIHKAEYLFMRSLGKVTEKIEVQHPEPVVIQRANGDIVALDVAKNEDE